MVMFRFYDENATMINNIDASDDLPENAVSMNIRGPFNTEMSPYKLLTKMLERTTKKLEEIVLDNLSAETPDFLAFLVLICKKSNSLKFKNCRFSVSSSSCLMAALLASDGVRSLSFSIARWSAPPALILLRGIESSPCLESLNLHMSFTDGDDQDVGTSLIQALHRNQSLKDISLWTYSICEGDPAFLPNLLRSSILGSKVRSISIEDVDRNLHLDVLQDVLCRKDCVLEKLRLTGVNIFTEEDSRYWSVMQNTSVRHLAVTSSSLYSRLASETIRLFKSLEELDLNANSLVHFSFLDDLLFGERSQLKGLDISCNNIDDEGMVCFIEKFRKVKGLKYLNVGAVENRDESVYDTIIDVFQNNTDLEHLDFSTYELPLHLNRAGRRVFDSSQTFPSNLLPHVLERASKILYYDECNSWGSPNQTYPRRDVVFWMIQRIVPNLQI